MCLFAIQVPCSDNVASANLFLPIYTTGVDDGYSRFTAGKPSQRRFFVATIRYWNPFL